MTIPEETTPTSDGVTGETVTPGPAPAQMPTDDLGTDWICDLDSARMEVVERRVIGDATYQVRECSSNPAHIKMVPA